MSQVEKLLRYQEEDAKLLKLEKEISTSVERKNLAQAVNFVTKANEKLEALEGKAIALNAMLAELNNKYSELSETLSEFDNLEELLEEGADISFYKKSIAQVSEKLKALKQEVASLGKNIRESDEEFRTLYIKNRAMQKQGKEYQEAYEKLKEEKKAERESIKKNLEVLAAEIDPNVMRGYQIKRSEHIIPVLCVAKNDRCTKCGYELSLVGKERIASQGVVECENCHRYLYKE